MLLLAGAALAQGPGKLPPWENAAYPLIHPPYNSIPWKKAPWHTDLKTAIKEAKAEERPLMIWVSGDHPLERC
jgi:hypothetical protein